MTHDSRTILDLPMQANDADATTIRDYLIALLAEVWRDRECFSGKRPFGNSSWQYELYRTLVTAGVIYGVFDEYGDLDDVDDAAGDQVIDRAIQALGQR